MKKFLIFVASAAMMASCGISREETDRELKQQRDSLQAIIDNKDNELNDIIGTMTEVQEGIRRISEAEGRIVVADGNRESASSREVIRDNMEFIQKAMDTNREMIAHLKEKLNSSQFNVTQLKRMIESLRQQVADQDARIQELQAQIAEKDAQIEAQGAEISNLNENVSNLTEENKKQAGQLADQDKAINTAWFVYGTKTELKDQGILKSGDVLKQGDFNRDYFTKIDIRQTKLVKTYSKNVRLLTTHPSDSYKLEKDAKGLYELQITNAQKFWSVSRYLVMQVK